MSISAQTLHREQVLQDHLVAQLVGGEGYELRASNTDYDCALALDKAIALRFVRSTQHPRQVVLGA